MLRARAFLFSALVLASAGFYQPMDYDNTKSRYMLLSAIVDEGRLSIDSHQQYTIDKAFSQGHYYSIKPIGLPLMSAPFYWLLRRFVLGPASLLPDPTILADPAAKYLVRVLTVSLPFALLALVLFQFLLAHGIAARHALWSCLAYGLGTIALNHATIFSGHQTAAFFLFSSFALLFHLSKNASRPGAAALGLLAGLWAGCAVLCDYLTIVYAIVLAIYAVTLAASRKAKLAFIVGAALAAAVLASYNQICFSNPWSTGYSHLDFAPFREYTERGLFGISWPDPRISLALLTSVSRGLLLISPVLLFALMGLVFLYRRPQCRREFYVVAAMSALALLLYSGYPGWHGGWTFGPRYLVPILPFLALPMALAADGGFWFQLLFWPSVLQVALAQLGAPHVSPEIRNPIVEFIIPLMREGGGSLSFLGGARPGNLLGGILQYALVFGLAALALRELPETRRRRLPWRWRAGIAAWAGYVLLALIFTRTSDQKLLHRYRGLVLNDTAAALRSLELERTAQHELAQGR